MFDKLLEEQKVLKDLTKEMARDNALEIIRTKICKVSFCVQVFQAVAQIITLLIMLHIAGFY